MSSYQTLPSNSCPKTRPNNKASDFIVDYENPINLDGQWEVALVEFSYRHFQDITLRKDMQIDYMQEWFTEEKLIAEILFSSQSVSMASVSDGIYSHHLKVFLVNNILEIKFNHPTFKVIFNSLEDAKQLGFTKTTVESKEFVVRGESQIIIKPNQRCTFTVKYTQRQVRMEQIKIGENVFVDSTDKLKKVLLDKLSPFLKNVEIADGKCKYKVNKEIVYVNFPKDLAMILGLNAAVYYTDETKEIIADLKPKLSTALSQMYIYTNIIEPIYVGGAPVPLLRCIWIEQKNQAPGDIQNVTIEHPMYLPVSIPCINKIEVNIRDDGGNLIDFDYGSKTSLTLHFRKLN